MEIILLCESMYAYYVYVKYKSSLKLGTLVKILNHDKAGALNHFCRQPLSFNCFSESLAFKKREHNNK